MGLMGLGSSKDDKEANKDSSNGCAGVLLGIVVIVALLALVPLAVFLFPIFAVVGERRLVRLSRWWMATGIATVIGLAAAGFNLTRWLGWFSSAPALLWGKMLGADSPIGLFAHWGKVNAQEPHLNLALQHILTSVPLALFAMCFWWWWRSYAMSLRAEHEGEQYSNQRPVGWLDKRRIERNTAALQEGSWSNKNDGKIAVGIGKYGEVADVDLGELKKTVLVVGTSRSGKTRQANSLAAQQVMNLGGANITIDWKGDEALAQAKAELARQRGVPFLHFKMIPRAGGNYTAPHPYAPDRPAHYDPLMHGNGSSKAAMLLDSVDREGDAAAYARTANEAVKLAYDIAALNGYDQHRDRRGHPVGGFTLLARMLEPEFLVKAGRAVTIEKVQKVNPFLTTQAAEAKVEAIHDRISSFEQDLKERGSLLSNSLNSVRSTVSSYINDSSVGPFLSPGSIPSLRIDLVRAILRNEIIVFSLDSQEDPKMAAMIGTMVLLDLQNAVSTLRNSNNQLADLENDPDSDFDAEESLWNPVVLQIEELSAVQSPAAATAMLGLFNKSADVGVRPIISTQSLADIEAVDGTGVWLRQLMAQLDHLMTLQLSEAKDAEKVAAFSGMVQKKIAMETKEVSHNRTGLFQGAAAAGTIRSTTEDQTRIGQAEALRLTRVTPDNPAEFLWVSKVPEFTAVHTNTPEGPNNWAEHLKLVPVHERPHKWKSWGSREFVEQSRQQRNETFSDMLDDLQHNPVVHRLTSTARAEEAVQVEQTIGQARAANAAPEPVADSQLQEPFGEDVAPQPEEEHDDVFSPVDDGGDDDFDFAGSDGDDFPDPQPRQQSRPAQSRSIADTLDDDDDPF